MDADAETRHRIAAELGSDVPFFLAGGPALVEGRGERVTPLGWLRDADAANDRPGAAAGDAGRRDLDPAAFAAFDAGARLVGGAARQASAHLADELRTGLRVADLLARASVLAAANDLAPAAAVVEPGLVPFKRALLRLLARPVGLSGSGPTHWALYPSHRRCGRGRRPRARGVRGRRAAHAGRHGRRSSRPRGSSAASQAGREAAMTRQAISTDRRPRRPRPVQPGHRHRRPRVLQRPARARPRDGRARRWRRGPDGPRPAQPLGGARRGGAHAGRRREDHDLPRRHRRLRGGQRRLREPHARSAARALDVRRRRRSPRLRWWRSR